MTVICVHFIETVNRFQQKELVTVLWVKLEAVIKMSLSSSVQADVVQNQTENGQHVEHIHTINGYIHILSNLDLHF